MIEFASSVWKKVRTKQLSELEATMFLKSFESDTLKYTFVHIDGDIISSAKQLITMYGKAGLRTLDSIQLATAVSLKGEADLFITSDKLLADFFQQESLPILAFTKQ
jgi:predicted nucleic acid-binding protein